MQSTALSSFVLSEKFQEYRSLYQQVLNFEFAPETSIFTGYETLPVWEQQRKCFVEIYNQMKEAVD